MHASRTADETLVVADVAGPQPPGAAAPRGHLEHPHAALLLSALAVLVLALALEIRSDSRVALAGFVLPETCYWRGFFGWNCPGCGLTRSFVSLAHAEPARAWQFHPAGPLLFAALLFQVPYRAVQWRRVSRGREPLRWPALALAPIVLAGGVVVSWMWRLAN